MKFIKVYKNIAVLQEMCKYLNKKFSYKAMLIIYYKVSDPLSISINLI